MTETYSEMLYRALESPFGVVLVVQDFVSVQQELYATRRALNDPALAVLSFRHSPANPNTELWIVRNASA